MAVVNVSAGSRTVQMEMVTPDPQASTNSTVVVTGSEICACSWQTVAYTIKVATAGVKWSVWGANLADYSDEVAVLAAVNVAAAASSSYTAVPAPFLYYRVKITSNVADTPGTATVCGVAKG